MPTEDLAAFAVGNSDSYVPMIDSLRLADQCIDICAHVCKLIHVCHRHVAVY